ncbi:hypothetical protein CKA32_004040 [Geitlerinema sp. FC II]|nr:hypothetical protein CKA32_004040 [Geitlerinema sp. FC II]
MRKILIASLFSRSLSPDCFLNRTLAIESYLNFYNFEDFEI